MLCFVFAALIVALDQFFKHWVTRTLGIGETGQVLIPGVLGLTRWENDGAMLNILSGQQWLLAGIAFCAAVVLVMILLRYNEGFWGTIGLAAVLGGTVGNLVDRIFNDGKVVDMFRTLFVNFPIFNIADMFITLGFITFLIHFIMLTVKEESGEKAAEEYADDEYYDEYDEQEYDEQEYDEFDEIDSAVAAQTEQELYPDTHYPPQSHYQEPPQYEEPAQYSESNSYDQETQNHYDTELTENYDDLIDNTTLDTSYSLDALDMEFGSLDDYNVDDLLREYGFENDDDN